MERRRDTFGKWLIKQKWFEPILKSVRLKFTLMYIGILVASCFIGMVSMIGIYMVLVILKIPHSHTDGIWISMLSLAICGAFGSTMMFAITKKISRPIIYMTEQTKKIARGDFDVKIPVRSQDEIGQLASHFNLMTEELKTNALLRKDFISSVSHEFKTPLASITAFVEAIREPEVERETFMAYTDVILEEASRLNKLTMNMLRLTKLDHQKIITAHAAFALDEQIRRCALLLVDKWQSKDIDLQLELVPVQIQADEELLAQVWLNLLENAIKFTPEKGIVQVSLLQKRGVISVIVADSGQGIALEEQDRIFDAFYQTDESHHDEGHGLGLAITKRICELHDAQINCETSELGGARFIVTF